MKATIAAVVVASLLLIGALCWSRSEEATAQAARAERLQTELNQRQQRYDAQLNEVRQLREKIERLERAASMAPVSSTAPTAASGTTKLAESKSTTAAAAEEKLRKKFALADAQRTYSLLGEVLDLPPDQEEQIIDLLAKELDSTSTVAPDAVERRGRVAAIIGPEKVGAFDEFETHLREYMHVGEFSRKLVIAGDPLSEKQKTDLVALMADERKRKDSPNATKGFQSLKDIEAEEAWAGDYDNRVMKAAASLLSSRQRRAMSDDYAKRAQDRARVVAAQRKQLAETGTAILVFPAY